MAKKTPDSKRTRQFLEYDIAQLRETRSTRGSRVKALLTKLVRA